METCAVCCSRDATNLIYFDNSGPIFPACRRCAYEAPGFYGTVVDLAADGQVMIAMPGGVA